MEGNVFYLLFNLSSNVLAVLLRKKGRRVSDGPLTPDAASTHRLVIRLVVNVHKAPIDVGQGLQLILQVLRDIMRSPERHLAIDDNVNLDEIVGARVVDAALRRERGREGGGGHGSASATNKASAAPLTVSICLIASLNVMAL